MPKVAPVPDWNCVGATSVLVGPVYGNVEVRREVGQTAALGAHDDRRIGCPEHGRGSD